jgi:nucleotide-binding universal stress UspA family protein
MFHPKKILVPVDLSDCSRQALRWAERLARTVGAHLDVFYAIPPNVVTVPNISVQNIGMPLRPLIDVVRHEALNELDGFVKATLGPRSKSIDQHLVWGEPARQILQYAIEEGHELIVMGTHGRTGFRHFLRGSVATKVVREAPCPVLTLGPSAHQGTKRTTAAA